MENYKNSKIGLETAPKYGDIIEMERPQTEESLRKHPRMTLQNRAKIFLTFSPLRGYDEQLAAEKQRTGRCRELLLPGVAVRLEVSDNPKRKTKYDLVAVHKQELGWVNMDSQAPNKVVGEWLSKQEFDLVRPEFAYGRSRIDFYMEKGEQKYLLEVKGCTLEVGGIGYFPDAPTERGVKHLHELAQAQRAGYRCAVAFVIQMEGVTEVRPNVGTQPEFGTALAEAKAVGVRVLFLLCHVGRDSLEIVEQREA